MHAAGAPASRQSARILLILPFENRTGQPSLEWIREAAPEILSGRLSLAGLAPLSRADRLYALDHLGLPQGFLPSRASSLKLAETVDADSIIVGNYLTDGSAILVEARIVDVPRLSMSAPVTARGEMHDMVAVFNSLAWELARQFDPEFNVAQETFVADGAGLRLDALEQYTRGVIEPDQQERLRHLNQAVTLSPGFGKAWMALGREEYSAQQYEQAAADFAKVGPSEADALEAGFYRGLSLLFSGAYQQAEQAFATVAHALPLAEVINNQAIAISRQGRDATAIFVQASAADPTNADYHFNLAVSLMRHGTPAAAANELAECLKLRPKDTEAQDLEKSWKAPAPLAARLPAEPNTPPDADAKADPLERIMRTFDAVAFRQAALMMDQFGAVRLAALEPSERAQKLASQAREFLDRGLLLEAERLYLAALAADPKAAEAHAGLASLRERSGDPAAARKEAIESLELMPSADAYLVLGQLDLAAGRWTEAGHDAAEALKLAPQSRAAQEFLRKINARNAQHQ